MRAGAVALRVVASIVIGAAFLIAVNKQIDVVPDDLSPVHAWALPAFAITLIPYFVLRAGRWWIMLRTLGTVSFFTAIHAALAGIMWTALLPFRLGELARPLIISRRTDISVGTALGTVALERVVDGLTVCLLFFGVFGIGGSEAIDPEFAVVYQISLVVVVGFLFALVALLLAARFPTLVRRAVTGSLGRVWPPAGAMVARFAGNVARGLASLPSASHLLQFLAVTMAYWGVNVLGTWILARGLGLPLSGPEAAAVVAVINLALLIPAGPVQLGSFQAGVFLGLSLFMTQDLVASAGAQFVFWLYILQMAGAVMAGAIGHLSLGASARAALGPLSDPEDPPRSGAGGE